MKAYESVSKLSFTPAGNKVRAERVLQSIITVPPPISAGG